MKITIEIRDDLYRLAKIQAAQENRKMEDFVSDGLRLVLGLSQEVLPSPRRRMTKAPVTIRKGNVIPAFSNDEMAELLERSSEPLR